MVFQAFFASIILSCQPLQPILVVLVQMAVDWLAKIALTRRTSSASTTGAFNSFVRASRSRDRVRKSLSSHAVMPCSGIGGRRCYTVRSSNFRSLRGRADCGNRPAHAILDDLEVAPAAHVKFRRANRRRASPVFSKYHSPEPERTNELAFCYGERRSSTVRNRS
jgi:hypothetical protein